MSHNTPENVAMAIAADTERTITRTIGVCVTIVLLCALSSLTYCSTRPPRPVQPDPAKVRENELAKACLAAGNSWLPVMTVYANGNSDIHMSCVTPTTLPLVTAMNARKP